MVSLRPHSFHLSSSKGSNLASSHSLDQVDIVIDGIHNACRPLNYTDTDLTCSLSESATKYFQHDEPFVEVSLPSASAPSVAIEKVLFFSGSRGSLFDLLDRSHHV